MLVHTQKRNMLTIVDDQTGRFVHILKDVPNNKKYIVNSDKGKVIMDTNDKEKAREAALNYLSSFHIWQAGFSGQF